MAKYLQHIYPLLLLKVPAHTSPTTTLPLPSNEGCRHGFSLPKDSRMRAGRKIGGENHGIDTHQVRVETCLATDVVIPVGAVSLASLCPAAIANPTPMPMRGKEWAVTSTASNSAHPTMTNHRHVNQPWCRRPWPLTGNQPWWQCRDDDHLDSEKPCVES